MYVNKNALIAQKYFLNGSLLWEHASNHTEQIIVLLSTSNASLTFNSLSYDEQNLIKIKDAYTFPSQSCCLENATNLQQLTAQIQHMKIENEQLQTALKTLGDLNKKIHVLSSKINSKNNFLWVINNVNDCIRQATQATLLT